MVKYKIDFKRCYLYLRIFIMLGITPREQKEALVFDKVVPSVPQKNYGVARCGSGFVDSATAVCQILAQ